MSDTYTGECKVCHEETDLIYGICGNCTSPEETMTKREILELLWATAIAQHHKEWTSYGIYGIDQAEKQIEALHTIDWEDVVKAMDCLGYHGLGTKLTSKEIEKMAKSITKYINTREQ